MENVEKRNERIAYNLKLLQGGRSSQEMSEIMNCSYSTYRRRLVHPEELTVEEIWRLCEFTGVNVMEFIGGTLKIGGVLK